MAGGSGECPKKKDKAERSRTYAPANFRCHFEERSFEPRAFGIACERGLTPVQELEAMPRLVWPQEASEALLGHRHPQMQTQVMIFGTPEHPVTQRCRWSRLWGL